MSDLDTRLGPLAAGFVRAVFKDRKARLSSEGGDSRQAHAEALQDAGKWATLIDTGVLVCEGWVGAAVDNLQVAREGRQLSGDFGQLRMV